MKNKSERIIKYIMITFVIIFILIVLFVAIKFISNYFNMSDEQICGYSNSVLINGQCHSECNAPVDEKRKSFLLVAIFFSFIGIVLTAYTLIILKTKFKEK